MKTSSKSVLTTVVLTGAIAFCSLTLNASPVQDKMSPTQDKMKMADKKKMEDKKKMNKKMMDKKMKPKKSKMAMDTASKM